MHWIVITGNPKDGFTHIGPFDAFEDAMNEGASLDGDWWTAQLVEPAGFVKRTAVRDMSQIVEVTDPRD